ncbi:MAG: hypothetical protein ACR2MO_02445 [Acidimicrobiales bacterium]
MNGHALHGGEHPRHLPVPGDYDGNGTTDIAVYRPSTGQWFVRNISTTGWGVSGDVPLTLPYAIRKVFFA